MEKRKRESPERSFGESESVSSQSDIIQPESTTMESRVDEIQSLEVETEKSTMESHGDEIQSLEVETDIQAESTMESYVDEIQSSKVSMEVETENKDLKDSIKTLTEKLSAALANVSAKDDLVKQHVKVAEEAVAGWEKAENEVVELKKKLEVADDKNKVLEDRVSHLDGALKECVRQLRQARDEQEQRIQDSVTERTKELESSKTSLENQILEAARKSEELSQMAESVAKENVMLRHELLARCEELEIRTIERDLSTQAAESASKQQLDSIKKVAKLEAECRKLRMLAKSSSSFNDHRSTDSHSDGGERMDSESWTSSTLIDKRSLQGTSSIEIDLMGDFLEMERLVALPETPDGNSKSGPESVTEEAVVRAESSLAAEIKILTCRTKQLEEDLEKLQAEKDELESEVKCNREVVNTLRFELEAIVYDKMELEDKLEKMEVEKAELQISFDIIKDRYKESQDCIQEIEMKLEEIQKEMKLANERKAEVESQIIAMEVEAKTKSAKIESMEEDVKKERLASDELKRKCEALEEDVRKEKFASDELKRKCEALEEDVRKEKFASDELKRKCEALEEDVRKDKFDFDELRRKCEALEEEVSLHQENAIKRENTEPKIKPEDIETAAGKLANCQKTIASLGKQLQSLATLEDFLTDTASIPAATNGVSSRNSNSSSENWKVHKNESFTARNLPESIKPTKETPSSLASSSSSVVAASTAAVTVSSNRGSSEKNRNGFAKVFTRSKDGIHLAI